MTVDPVVICGHLKQLDKMDAKALRTVEKAVGIEIARRHMRLRNATFEELLWLLGEIRARRRRTPWWNYRIW